MDYTALVLFLILHYVRPQEWFSFVNALKPVQVLAALALYAIYQRKKPVRMRDLWSTPHDYMVTAYFAWTIFASPTPKDTFRNILPLIFFYFVGVLTLNTLPRLTRFLGYWAWCIFFIATLAMLSTIGIDPLHSNDLIESWLKGRLAVNLSIFNNPNSLGHAIVPVIPLLYYLLFWKKTFGKVRIVILVIPIACIFMTLSKGAFVSAALTFFATLTFGRPKRVQIAMVIGAALFGGTLLYALPRMNELNHSKTDQAIQGRVAAMTFGMQQMLTKTYGHGLGNFTAEFYKHGPMEATKHVRLKDGYPLVYYVRKHYYKAPHSAYNQNGADLGFTGFMLFIGVMYTCLRTLIFAKTANDEEELVRRCLFAIVLSYAVSSWMVDFCYRPTFFLFTAATSALHRHLRGAFEPVAGKKEEDDDAEEPPVESPWRQPILPPPTPPALEVITVGNAAVATLPPPALATAAFGPPPPGEEPEPAPAHHGTIAWERFGLLDLALTYVLAKLAVRFWQHLIESM
jgi:hypothetical protein